MNKIVLSLMGIMLLSGCSTIIEWVDSDRQHFNGNGQTNPCRNYKLQRNYACHIATSVSRQQIVERPRY